MKGETMEQVRCFGSRFGFFCRLGCGVALLAALVSIALVPASTPVAAGTTTVKMVSGHVFQPELVTINVGATVTWTNADSVEIHNVEADDGSFGIGALAHNQTYSYTFTTPGVFGYYCTFHDGMVGTITVVASSATSTPTATPLPLPTRHSDIATVVPVISVPPTHVAAPTIVMAPAPLAQPVRH